MQQAFWNPFSQRARTAADSVTFVSGDRSTLEDSEGRRYLDATGGLWYSLIGHGRSEMAEAVSRQMSRLEACSCFDVYASQPTLDLADQLAGRVPVPEPLVFFTSNGSDSIDTAAKVVLLYWNAVGQPERRHLLHREGSYHGMHGFGTSLAGIPGNRQPGPIMPERGAIPMFDLRATEARIDAIGADRIAAVFAEPVIGAGGVFPPPDGYLRGLAELCRRSGCLLVVDEVVTGFGRTGEYFASEAAGIEPDILVVAKGLTSGYLPLSAAVFNGTIAEPFEGKDGLWLRHGYTYSGHATACAAGLENLAIIDRENLVGRVRELAPVLRDALAPLTEHESVSEIRSIGLTAAVQFDPRVEDAPGLVMAAADACRRLGVATRGLASNALHVSPPFVIEEAEIRQLADVFDAALTQVEESRRSVVPRG